MKVNALQISALMLAPFESGGNFDRARNDPRTLLMELRAELEEVRSRRRQLQERLKMSQKQISDCTQSGIAASEKSVYGLLVGAAVALIFGLLFSAGAMVTCGACGQFGLSGLLIIVAVILALRAWGEYRDCKRMKKNKSCRIEQYSEECRQYSEQIYKLNLREAELDECIRAAQRYM